MILSLCFVPKVYHIFTAFSTTLCVLFAQLAVAFRIFGQKNDPPPAIRRPRMQNAAQQRGVDF